MKPFFAGILQAEKARCFGVLTVFRQAIFFIIITRCMDEHNHSEVSYFCFYGFILKSCEAQEILHSETTAFLMLLQPYSSTSLEVNSDTHLRLSRNFPFAVKPLGGGLFQFWVRSQFDICIVFHITLRKLLSSVFYAPNPHRNEQPQQLKSSKCLA